MCGARGEKERQAPALGVVALRFAAWVPPRGSRRAEENGNPLPLSPLAGKSARPDSVGEPGRRRRGCRGRKEPDGLTWKLSLHLTDCAPPPDFFPELGAMSEPKIFVGGILWARARPRRPETRLLVLTFPLTVRDARRRLYRTRRACVRLRVHVQHQKSCTDSACCFCWAGMSHGRQGEKPNQEDIRRVFAKFGEITYIKAGAKDFCFIDYDSMVRLTLHGTLLTPRASSHSPRAPLHTPHPTRLTPRGSCFTGVVPTSNQGDGWEAL